MRLDRLQMDLPEPSSLWHSTLDTRAAEYKALMLLGHASWLMVEALSCVLPHFQWHHLADATDIKPISIVWLYHDGLAIRYYHLHYMTMLTLTIPHYPVTSRYLVISLLSYAAQSYTPNIYTPPLISCITLIIRLRILLINRLCSNPFRATDALACWMGAEWNKDFHCNYATANHIPGTFSQTLA